MAAYAVRLEALYGEALEARASGAVSTDRDLLRSLGSELQRFCARRDGGPAWLSERRTLIETVDRLAIGVESARLGEWVQFCAPETRRFWQPAAGFSTVEPWGIWTDGAFASVMTRLPTGADRRVTFRLRPFLPDADKRQLVVEVFGNGLPLASWRFDNAQECDQVVTVPATLLTEGAPFWFGFRIDRPCSPQALNLSPDARLLGVGFLSMIIEAQDSPPSATPLPPIQRPSETPRRGILRALFSRRRRQ